MFAKLVLTLDRELRQTTPVIMALTLLLETPSPPNHTLIQAFLPHLNPEKREETLHLREPTNLDTDTDSWIHLTLPHTFREEPTQAVKKLAPF